MDEKKNRLKDDVGKAETAVGSGARKGWNAGKGAVGRVERGFRREDKKDTSKSSS